MKNTSLAPVGVACPRCIAGSPTNYNYQYNSGKLTVVGHPAWSRGQARPTTAFGDPVFPRPCWCYHRQVLVGVVTNKIRIKVLDYN